MPRRSRFVLAPIAFGVALFLIAIVPAGAGSVTAARRGRVIMKCKDSLKVNRYFKEGCRFDKDRYEIRSGSTLTIVNRSEEPHTLSVVKRSQAPRTVKKAEKCFQSGPCASLSQAHGFPEGEGPPANPVVNAGGPGLDVPGDSVFIAPKAKTTIQVTAKKGQKLYFICIIHPQMQALLSVR